MDDKRNAIIRATAEMLEGETQVTVDKVAAAAGVAKGTVYLYFKNKQELIQQTLFAGIAELYQVVDAAATQQHGNSFARLEAMVTAHFSLARGQILVMQRLFQDEPNLMQHPDHCFANDAVNEVKRVEDLYAQQLQQGMNSGELRPHNAEIIAAALLAMIHNLSATQNFRPHLKEEEIVAEILTMVLQGITSESE